MGFFSKFSSPKYRWLALLDIALGLAIVVVDNTILNVSIPYILRDLHTQFANIQWIISGYALVIATSLITASRIADIWGRKKTFISGILIFMTGSFIGSTAQDAQTIIIGRAIIQAVGAAFMLPSALSLLNTTFPKGREKALAFGIWGSVAGAAASVGPILGGYLTTYLSWRWSLRINIIIGIVAILGSIFIMDSRGKKKSFDMIGSLVSGLGLFLLDFAIIEGPVLGFQTPKTVPSLLGITWPFPNLSIVPVLLIISAALFIGFIIWELRLEKFGKSPLILPQMFLNKGFVFGLITLFVLAFGQFSTFFILPIYLENVLTDSAFSAGFVLLAMSISIFIAGTSSGYIARVINLKWVIFLGIAILTIGNFFLIQNVTTHADLATLSQSLILIGLGFGLASAQLNNIVISSVDVNLTGEAAGTSTTFRQIGASLGVAVIGSIFSAALLFNVVTGIKANPQIPPIQQQILTQRISHYDIESDNLNTIYQNIPQKTTLVASANVRKGISEGSRTALTFGLVFIFIAAISALMLPKHNPKGESLETMGKE